MGHREVAWLALLLCAALAAPPLARAGAAKPGRPPEAGTSLPAPLTHAEGPQPQHPDGPAPVLPRNQPTDVQGVMAVCTGIDDDSRKDARWNSYPLKLEFAAANGEYLAYAEVSVTDHSERRVVAARCPGAWLLLGLSPGMYKASVSVIGQPPQTIAFVVPMTGQKSIVLHFAKPADGGDISTGTQDHS